MCIHKTKTFLYQLELSTRGETTTPPSTTKATPSSPSLNGTEPSTSNHGGLALGIGLTVGLLLFLLAAISGGFFIFQGCYFHNHTPTTVRRVTSFAMNVIVQNSPSESNLVQKRRNWMITP